MAANYASSVFINCPFDEGYRPLFEAITFTVYQCGFYPRCALEIRDSSQVRIEKIIGIIKECRLAVHDISRTQLDPATQLPRFNMPLELGLFLGAKVFGSPKQKQKAAVVFDSEKYRYQAFMSDYSGYDIHAHGQNPERVIEEARDFLASHSEDRIPGSKAIVTSYQDFQAYLPDVCKKFKLSHASLTFQDLTRLILTYLNG